MNSVRFKKTVISILCLSFVFSAFFCNADVNDTDVAKADVISDYEDKIDELEQQQKEIEAEIKDLQSKTKDKEKEKQLLAERIAVIQSQITLCNTQIAECDNKIANLEQDIADKETELEKTKYLFSQRLRAIYMSGGMTASTLSVILSAENLSDLLTKTELTKNISAYDNALMAKLVSDMEKIEKSKADIVLLIEEQKGVKAILDQKKAELNKQVSDINSVISDIKDDVSSLKNQSDKLEKAIAEYEQAIKDAQNQYKDQYYDGKFAWPCPGHYNITSPYGYRNHPISGKYKFHKGIDIAGGGIKGKPIVAAADGIVSIAKYNSGGYGYYVMVNHGTGDDGKTYVTLYAHMSKYKVKVGQKVKKGETIGYVGTTGASTGYHLHFEVRVNGNTTNPKSYFK